MPFGNPQHGKAALHLAAENGYDKVADVLLSHKAFVNAKSKLGLSPLHLSAQNGFSKLVKLLIESHGATIDALSLVSGILLIDLNQNFFYSDYVAFSLVRLIHYFYVYSSWK